VILTVVSCTVKLEILCWRAHSEHVPSHSQTMVTNVGMFPSLLFIAVTVIAPLRQFYDRDDDTVARLGYVADGTACDTGACLDQQCVAVADLTDLICPVGPNGLPCSGNGVC